MTSVKKGGNRQKNPPLAFLLLTAKFANGFRKNPLSWPAFKGLVNQPRVQQKKFRLHGEVVPLKVNKRLGESRAKKNIHD